jgi:DNA repair protein RadA/Sms
VAGGLKITEPAADLAVAAALVSSLTGAASAADTVVFGEIGLSAEVRAVGQTESRLKEAAKLGFTRAIMPARRKSKNAGAGLNAGLQIEEIGQVSTLAEKFLAAENGASVRRLAKPH